MLEFKNMRHRVEFAYEKMDVDIYYNGSYRYTVEDHMSKRLFENLVVDQVDKVLNELWSGQ